MPGVETVLNKPLSGKEVKDIIMAKLSTSLGGDCRLADYIAVPAFRFRLDIAIVLNSAVEGNVDYTLMDGRGKVDEDTAQAVTVHLEQREMPPNQARVDAGIGVPVLTSDDKGRPVEREVKYAKEKIVQAQQRSADAQSNTVSIPGIG
jgi:hypothetical protein